MSDRLDNERLFHDRRFGGDDTDRQRIAKYYSIGKLSGEYYTRLVTDLCAGADLLEYGCGTGSFALIWAKNGADVTGIDISGEGIKKAKERAADIGAKILFCQMNAEGMGFGADSFDVVTGKGIIHHLDLKTVYRELSRVLRTNGHAVFIEPLGHNPAINLYRKYTPSIRTRSEHPLLVQDIDDAKRYFENVTVKHFHILTLLAVPFRNLSFFERLLYALHSVDESLMYIFPFLKRYSWVVVIDLHRPKTSRQANGHYNRPRAYTTPQSQEHGEEDQPNLHT